MEMIKTEQEFQTVIDSDKPTIAVFKTTWCKDCHYIEPFMPQVEEAYADRLRFVQIDRDELPDLCETYNILGIPSFIGFHQGKELGRFVSKLRKTREEIEQFLDQIVQAGQTAAS